MSVSKKIECIRSLNFGSQVAEEERFTLKDYFVHTQAWDRIQRGEIDIVYGPKGSGKSAIYVLTQDNAEDLFLEKNVIQIAAENPRGTPAFKDLNTNPPTSEREFVGIWKLYFCSLLGRALDEFGIKNEHAKSARSVLDEHDLLPVRKTPLGSILAGVRSYSARLTRPSSVEGGMIIDPASGMPAGVSGKITFVDPDIKQKKSGFLSVDELLGVLDDALGEAQLDAWLMIDRLDVAFDESSELETNALRALFRAYRDIRTHAHITPKIFLRNDIWDRISQDGFREATHLSRGISLRWDKATLKNLIVRRVLNNPLVLDLFEIDKEKALLSVPLQDEVFKLVFPSQVEVGAKQATTLDWMLRRTADGSGAVQPRDVIMFMSALVEIQNRRIERGEPEPETGLFDRSAFKEAMLALSEYKLVRGLFAEYPDLRPFIDPLRETKTEHNVDSLARIWRKSTKDTMALARSLRDVGFFEERDSSFEASYWVPFVYRPYLALSQGKVEELQSGDFFKWVDLVDINDDGDDDEVVLFDVSDDDEVDTPEDLES